MGDINHSRLKKLITLLLIVSLTAISGCNGEGDTIERLENITEESRLEVIEKEKNSYKGDIITKEELNQYIDESINAIDKNIPLYEKKIDEIEESREEIISTLDFDKLLGHIDGTVTFKDTEVGQGISEDLTYSIKGLKFINEKLATAIVLSSPYVESIEGEEKERFLEQRKQYVMSGHSTMEQEVNQRVSGLKRNIEDMEKYREFMISVRDQFGQESISLDEEQREIIREILEKNEHNLHVIEEIVNKVKNAKSESSASHLLKEFSLDMDILDSMSETEAGKLYYAETADGESPENYGLYNSDYKGIRSVDSVLADTIDNSILKAKKLEELNESLGEYGGPHPFYGLIDAPDEYYKNKELLLYDYTVLMMDHKLMIEEYNKVLKSALEGKVYQINNEFFHSPISTLQ